MSLCQSPVLLPPTSGDRRSCAPVGGRPGEELEAAPSTPALLTALTLGAWSLPNRVLMAPLTRARATLAGVPTADMVDHYTQRATAGLIIAEASNVSATSAGWARSPGLYTAEQVHGWRQVTDSVHRAGGRIIAQLFHAGRVGAVALRGTVPVSPSGIDDDLHHLSTWGELANGSYARLVADESRALEASEVEETIASFGHAAELAGEAGFDGVEIHAGNGYLIHEFLSPRLNQRADGYGGSVERRARFLLDILDTVLGVWPPAQVGVRITPFTSYNSAPDDDVAGTYRHLAREVSRRRIAFLEAADMDAGRGQPHLSEMLEILLPVLSVPLVVNGGLSPQQAENLIASGRAVAASFGWLYIANPDLPRRIAEDAQLAEARTDLPHRGLFGGGRAGYVDYPPLAVDQHGTVTGWRGDAGQIRRCA